MDIAAEQAEVKVGLLGDRKVGKTHLAHSLTQHKYNGYVPTESIERHEHQKEGVKFSYCDYPYLDREGIVQLGSVFKYEILVFVFRDCDSFTKVYDFLVEVKEVIEESGSHHLRDYWENLEKVVLVYSDYEAQASVEHQQLFSILTEQIHNFCPSPLILPFYLQSQQNNLHQLKCLIEEQVVQIHNKKVSSISNQHEPELKKHQSQQQEEHEVRETEEESKIEKSGEKEEVQGIKQQGKEVQGKEEQWKKEQGKEEQEKKEEEIEIKVLVDSKAEESQEQTEEERDLKKSQLEIRKSRIHQQIRDSFFGSSYLEEKKQQYPKQTEVPQVSPKEEQSPQKIQQTSQQYTGQYQEVAKNQLEVTKNQLEVTKNKSERDSPLGLRQENGESEERTNLLDDFRKPSKEDPQKVKEIDNRLKEYNDLKVQQLKNSNTYSEIGSSQNITSQEDKKDPTPHVVSLQEKMEKSQKQEMQQKQEKQQKQQKQEKLEKQLKQEKGERDEKGSSERMGGQQKVVQQRKGESKAIEIEESKAHARTVEKLPKPKTTIPQSSSGRREKEAAQTKGCSCQIM